MTDGGARARGPRIVAALLTGAALGVVTPTACGPLTCEEYIECSAHAGLRSVPCSDGDTYFNDGFRATDADEAFKYCYCNVEALSCVDGRSLTMCNTRVLNGAAYAEFSDQEAMGISIESGAAQCLGLDTCALVTEDCSYHGWYLRCSGSGGGITYLTSFAEVVGDRQSAIVACHPPIKEGPGSCREKQSSCSQLADCAQSIACYDDYDMACESTPQCYRNEDGMSCILDPACKWVPEEELEF